MTETLSKLTLFKLSENRHICPAHGYHTATYCTACRAASRPKRPRTPTHRIHRREATEAKQWTRGVYLRNLGVK